MFAHPWDSNALCFVFLEASFRVVHSGRYFTSLMSFLTTVTLMLLDYLSPRGKPCVGCAWKIQIDDIFLGIAHASIKL